MLPGADYGFLWYETTPHVVPKEGPTLIGFIQGRRDEHWDQAASKEGRKWTTVRSRVLIPNAKC